MSSDQINPTLPLGLRACASDIAIRVQNLSKCYQIYDTPRDRLKQFVIPRLERLVGQEGKQYFREFWALQDVSFEIKKGETVGIVGRNGSGKSTLLQTICGTLTPTSGTVETNGRIAALLELGSGFNPEFTGRENVVLNAAILGMRPDEIEDNIDSILDFSELGQFLDQPVKTYSSGMYVRLAFAISVHVSPQILIVDEALAVGDAKFQAKCMRRIKDMQETGVTILFVSHDVSSVRTLCDRAIWLEQGKLHMQGDVFPVSGAYMERIFEEEPVELPVECPDDNSIPVSSLEHGENELSHTAASSITTQQAGSHSSRGPLVDSRPTTHWGSHKGCISSARLYLASDLHRKKDIFEWDQEVVVRIVFRLLPGIERNDLSVAFSIKDLKGTDLIVSTTHDFKKKDYLNGESFTVDFSFTNILVDGTYLLVAALENGQFKDRHYYEYIEGAHYFSVISNHKLFGMVQNHIKQTVQAA